MEFFSNPWGLVALAGVPLVVALHLFRRRFRPVVVSAVFLWQHPDPSTRSGRTLEKLYKSPSFWLELCLAFLLAFLIAGLSLPWLRPASHLIVVLDGSASMAAGKGDERHRDLAVKEVNERISELSPRSRVTVITTGRNPRVLAGPSAFPDEATSRLNSYRPRSGQHSFEPGLALAAELSEEGNVLFITDSDRTDGIAAGVELVSIGAPKDNVGIVGATRISERESDQVFVTIRSFARQRTETRVVCSAGATPIKTTRLELEPDQVQSLSFAVDSTREVVQVELSADLFEIDNVATLVARPPRSVAVATDLPLEDCRFLGLAQPTSRRARLGRWLKTLDDVIEIEAPRNAHLFLTAAPPPPTQGWVLQIQPGGGELQEWVGPFLTEKHHPLLDGLTLDGIVWSAGDNPDEPGVALIAVGARNLLIETPLDRGRCYRLNMEIRRSSLHRSPDWPIFLHNLVEQKRATLPGPEETNLLVGQTFVYRQSEPAKLRLTGNSEVRELSATGVLVLSDLNQPGHYQLKDEEQVLCDIGVTFCDPEESDLRHCRPGRRESNQRLAALPANFGLVELALGISVLLLLLADWWVLNRSARRLAGN